MTNPTNAGFAQKGFGYVYPVSNGGSYDINQGDLCWFDTGSQLLKPLDSDAHAAYLAGYAYDSSFINLYGTKKYDPGVVAVCLGAGRFKTTSGDTYHMGDACYYSGVDAQTITNTAGGNTHIVGYAYLPFGNTVAGGTGVLIEMIVNAVYPSTGVQ